MAKIERLAIHLRDLRSPAREPSRTAPRRPERRLRPSRLSAAPPLGPSVGVRTRDKAKGPSLRARTSSIRMYPRKAGLLSLMLVSFPASSKRMIVC
jgi:hypothetical protein